MVPRERLELSWISPPASKTGVSANFTTAAKIRNALYGKNPVSQRFFLSKGESNGSAKGN